MSAICLRDLRLFEEFSVSTCRHATRDESCAGVSARPAACAVTASRHAEALGPDVVVVEHPAGGEAEGLATSGAPIASQRGFALPEQSVPTSP